MNLWESIRVALEGIWANKLRSLLTTLGIMIGIAAVIAVVAVGQGGRVLLMQEMEKIGTNIFAVYVDWRSDDPRTGREFALLDVAVIKELVPQVKYLAPTGSVYHQVRGDRVNKFAQVIGTSPDYTHIRKLELKQGRFFNQADAVGRRQVAVVDEELVREFFGRQTPLGQKITVRGTSLVVVGVIKKGGSMLEMGESKKVYIPIKVWQTIFPWGSIDSLEGSARTKDQVDTAMQQTVKVLERRHNTPDRYASVSLEQQIAAANKVTGIMTLIIGSIAGISLFVGGIGVMNIMLVSVTERTREIGIRKALGARRKDILTQFLIEAVVLCFIGGIIGMALGIGGAYLIAKIAKWPPLVSWWTALLAFGFSGAVGVIFGVLPANKASRLDPIEALRRD
jgi:putative ABC transport system permease protein